MDSGTRLGRYEILGRIGQGGMGEVWRARDTSLGREVAIKTLPPSLSQEPERLTRLTREASLLAAVSHPNIAIIHGLEELDGMRFIVLELVEGETLADRIGRGPLAIADALKLARQIAEALAAAHAQGVVHRDLKPANIKIAPGDRVKVLDFGLAKATADRRPDEATRTAMDTIEGTVLGTPAYMSPEQARGEAAGPQADLWAIGVIVFEMFTGVSPFKRPSSVESISAVLTATPEFAKLPAAVPPSARRALDRCLERDLDRRLHHALDARHDFEDALRELESPAPMGASSPTASRVWKWTAVSATAVAIVLGGWLISKGASLDVPRDPVRLSMGFAGRPSNLTVGATVLAISPSGSHVAFTAGPNLWIRDMKRSEPAQIVNSATTSNPFFSPDGRWVGFFDERGLRTVAVEGGAATLLAPSANRPAGATWHGDTIVFASTEGLYKVSANGGDARLLKAPDRNKRELRYAWPHFLPDGKSLLFTIVSDPSGTLQIALLNLDSLEYRTILNGASAARYVDAGAIVYAIGSSLKAMRFEAGTVTGEPLAIADVTVAAAPDNGAANFAIASNGTLVFAPPRAAGEKRRLTWIDRQGNAEALPFEPQVYSYPRISPDGKRIAVERTLEGKRDIWIIDPAREMETQLTDGPTEDLLPVWSPDGQRVWFASDRGGNFDIYSQAADGASPARLELAQPELQMTQSFVPDGTKLVVTDRFTEMMLFDLAKPGVMTPLLVQPEFDQRLGQVSPDGKWIAYESDESGSRFEIFVRPFPNVSGGRVQISSGGGRFPAWGPDKSDELYFVTAEGGMMSASVRWAPTFAVAGVRKLFDIRRPPPGRSGRVYDVARSDGRFLFAIPVADPTDANTTTQLTVILNFSQTLTGLGK